MSIYNLYDFFKKINYRRILPALLCPVLFLCTSISGFAAVESPILAGYVNSFEFVPVPTSQGTRVLPLGFSLDGSTTYYDSTYDDRNFNYDNLAYSSISSLYVGSNSASIDFDYIPELYDYYFYLTFHSNNINDSFSFFPTIVRMRQYTSPDNYIWVTPSYRVYHLNTDANHQGFSVLLEVPESDNASYNIIRVDDSNKGSVASDIALQGVILAFEKDTDSDVVNSIIAAINNQTMQQNNNFNNFMGSGSQFGGTTSGIQSGNDELSGFIDDYTEVEQSMYDKFTENQTAVSGNFSGWSWGSLSTAVDWTSDYLNRIYDNSGDFRTMFMYPILAGIALIFIGRQGLTAYVRSRREK